MAWLTKTYWWRKVLGCVCDGKATDPTVGLVAWEMIGIVNIGVYGWVKIMRERLLILQEKWCHLTGYQIQYSCYSNTVTQKRKELKTTHGILWWWGPSRPGAVHSTGVAAAGDASPSTLELDTWVWDTCGDMVIVTQTKHYSAFHT